MIEQPNKTSEVGGVVIENSFDLGESILTGASTNCDPSEAKPTATVTKCTNRLQYYRLLYKKR